MYNIPYNDIEANLFFDEYKDELLKRIKCYRNFFISKIDKKYYLFTEKENTYIKEFLDKYSVESELRKLITGRPIELLEIVKEVQSKCTVAYNLFRYTDLGQCKAITKANQSTIKAAKIIIRKNKTQAEQDIILKRDKIFKEKGIPDFRRILYNIFVDKIYDGTKNNKKIFDKSDFIRKKGLRVCPYCGRSYIFSVTRKGSNIDVKPQIDHFIPKGEFPFLAFSYYNLIPSCDSCNVVCKKEKKPLNDINDTYKVLNPYMFIDEPFFQFKLQNLNNFSDFLLAKEQDIQIDFNPRFKNMIEEYENLFGLKSLYKEHNDLVHDLLIRKQYWTSDTNQQYYKNILNCDPNIREKMILAFLGYYETLDGHGKRPFSKFLSDISAHYDELVKKGKQ